MTNERKKRKIKKGKRKMSEFRCLGRELERIVRALPRMNDFASDIPLVELEILMRARGLTNEQVEKCLSSHRIQMKEDAVRLRLLLQYGSDDKEIARNLRNHLDACKECRQAYLIYLDRKAEEDIRYSEKVLLEGDEALLVAAEEILREGYLGRMKANDSLGYVRLKATD